MSPRKRKGRKCKLGDTFAELMTAEEIWKACDGTLQLKFSPYPPNPPRAAAAKLRIHWHHTDLGEHFSVFYLTDRGEAVAGKCWLLPDVLNWAKAQLDKEENTIDSVADRYVTIHDGMGVEDILLSDSTVIWRRHNEVRLGDLLRAKGSGPRIYVTHYVFGPRQSFVNEDAFVTWLHEQAHNFPKQVAVPPKDAPKPQWFIVPHGVGPLGAVTAGFAWNNAQPTLDETANATIVARKVGDVVSLEKYRYGPLKAFDLPEFWDWMLNEAYDDHLDASRKRAPKRPGLKKAKPAVTIPNTTIPYSVREIALKRADVLTSLRQLTKHIEDLFDMENAQS